MKIKGLKRCKCGHFRPHYNTDDGFSIWKCGNPLEPYEIYCGEAHGLLKEDKDGYVEMKGCMAGRYVDVAFTLTQAMEKIAAEKIKEGGTV